MYTFISNSIRQLNLNDGSILLYNDFIIILCNIELFCMIKRKINYILKITFGDLEITYFVLNILSYYLRYSHHLI